MNLTSIKKIWDEAPLKLILFLAVFFRLLATLFSKGFGMFDDHYLIIEAAQSWADGVGFDKWVPMFGATEPSGHGLLYVGLHYFFFKFCNQIGFTDPDAKMYLIRFVHGMFSLLIVTAGYHITLLYSNIKNARLVGILLALYWFMPLLSVRNLIEVVCVPFVLYAAYALLKAEKQAPLPKWYLIAGLLAGLAIAIRFQTAFMLGGFGLYLLIKKDWKGTLYFSLGAIVGIGLTHGLIDYVIWGYPFAELIAYSKYNMNNAYTYITLPWYNYFLTLGGILLPPVSLFLLVGYFKTFKKYLLLFLPSFLFFAFHSYFPNKQERFIFPMIPFVIIAGTMGWQQFVQSSTFWLKRPLWLSNGWKFFWVINTLALIFTSLSYSKRSRVEAMLYLQHHAKVQAFVVEESNQDDWNIQPQFYLKKWVPMYGITKKQPTDTLAKLMHNGAIPNNLQPNYVLFLQPENLDARVADFSKKVGPLQYEATIEPGLMDKLLHWLNKNNDNNTTYIYKIILPLQTKQTTL